MFDRRSRIIKDGSTLSFDYVPEKLVHREAQMNELERLFSPLALDGRPCSAFIWGGVGTGKTVTAKRFCLDMAGYFQNNNRRLANIYVNCRMRGSEYSIILEMIRFFDPGFPERGFSMDEILALVKKNLEKQNMPMVIILDEVDAILKNGSKNLIYQLSRFSEGMSGGSLSLILISQYSVATLVDEASMSTFRRANTICFGRYTREELYDILVYRAGLAIEDGAVPRESLEMIAKTTDSVSDARFAIEILERAAHVAETEGTDGITLDCVRTASASVYSYVSERKLKELDNNRKFALLAIARAIKTAPSISITKCEKTYAVVCEEYNVSAKKHTQYYTYVQDMERQGLIKTEVRREPDGGRVTYISIDNIPPKELANKIEYLLSNPTTSEMDIG